MAYGISAKSEHLYVIHITLLEFTRFYHDLCWLMAM